MPNIIQKSFKESAFQIPEDIISNKKRPESTVIAMILSRSDALDIARHVLEIEAYRDPIDGEDFELRDISIGLAVIAIRLSDLSSEVENALMEAVKDATQSGLMQAVLIYNLIEEVFRLDFYPSSIDPDIRSTYIREEEEKVIKRVSDQKDSIVPAITLAQTIDTLPKMELVKNPINVNRMLGFIREGAAKAIFLCKPDRQPVVDLLIAEECSDAVSR